MGDYLKLFEKHSEYEAYSGGGEMLKPNVSYCEDNNEVHYNPIPIDPYNGHAYVDLELPSGTLWGTMNVGANSPTDYGLYFAWGETEGYTDASTKSFTWNDYQFNEGGSTATLTKYNETDGKTVLDAEDDAAAVNLGGEWHMPTLNQFNELVNNTKHGFIDTNGVLRITEVVDGEQQTSTITTEFEHVGVVFCKNDLNTSDLSGYGLESYIEYNEVLFFPAAGYCGDDSTTPLSTESLGFIWASELFNESVDEQIIVDYENAYRMRIGNDIPTDMYSSSRFYGQSVRGVVG